MRRPRTTRSIVRLRTAGLLVGATLLVARPGFGQSEEIRNASRVRLASHLAQTAGLLMDAKTRSPDVVATAHILSREASQLVPDNVDLLRFRLAMEALIEDHAGYEEALVRLSEVDPEDEVVRLKRLRLVIERHQSADERVVAYERILGGGDLDPSVASRLALDLALLHRRRGDIDLFADALARSVTLDPAHRTAVAIATGFFRMNVEDAEGETELLIALLYADPVDVVTQATLARLLLEHGAYRGSARMHEVTMKTLRELGSWPPDELIADLALSRLGAGRPDLALRIIDERQSAMNQRFRAALRRDQPELDALERSKYEAALQPTLGTVRAAILALDDEARAPAAARAAIMAYESMLRAATEREQKPPVQEIATRRLHQAFLAVALAHDVDLAGEFLTEANRLVPVSDAARKRFDGWCALRSGDADEAVRILTPLAEADALAAFGLAEAELARDRRRDAARQFLSVAKREPGSVVGVWAGRRLAKLLGREVPISEEARRLEDMIERVPRTIDELPENPSLAFSIDVSSSKPVYAAYEPIIVNLTITNNSRMPLTIDRDGPLRPQAMLQFDTTFNRRDIMASTPPIVIDIDRRLRLEPRERLVIPVDVRRFHFGQALNEAILVGAFVRVRAMLNFVARPNGVIEPGLLGVQHDSTTIRIEGDRVTPKWAVGIIKDLEELDEAEDLTRIALLGHLPAVLDKRIASYARKRDVLTVRTDIGSRRELEMLDAQVEEHVQLMSMTSEALVQAYLRLDDISQAWLLAVVPIRALPEPIRVASQRSDSRIVRLTYLMYKLSGPDDPLIDAGIRSEDPTIRQVAETFARQIRELSEQGALPEMP